MLLVSVLLLLAGVLRWSIGDPRRQSSSRRRRARRADFGLLVEVATAPTDTAARMATDALYAAGVRATTAPASDGDRLSVLVFGSERERALAVLLDEQWPRQQT